MAIHQLAATVSIQSETGCSPVVAAVLCDLCAGLISLQTVALNEGSHHSKCSALRIRDGVQRLLQITSASPADIFIKERALELVKEVLGVEHEHYVALCRGLGISPHDPDWEEEAEAT